MPKKQKLNLEELKVQSFVTALEEQDLGKFRGGTIDPTCIGSCDCDTDTPECITDGETLNPNGGARIGHATNLQAARMS